MTRKRRGLSMTSILVLALVGTITAIVLGAMAVFLQTYQRSLIRSVQTSARQSVAQVGKTVEDYLDDVNSLMELLERKLEDPRQDRDDFFAAFLQIRPDVVAVTTYDAAGGLVDCRSRGAKRTEIYQNLSFDPNKMDDYAGGYVSTPHVASIFQLSLFVIDTETVKHILELDLIISRQSLCAIQRILIRRNLLLPQQFKNQREKIHSVSHWFYRIIKCSVLFFRHIQCTINLTCPYHILRK